MRTYRCFFLNRAWRIEKAEIVEAEDDEKALLAALQLVDVQWGFAAVEVWEGARKVFPHARDRVDIEELRRLLLGAGLMTSEDADRVH
jgi:hypothetical protein